MRRLALLFALLAAATSAGTPPARLRPGPERIAVTATPVPLDPADPSRARLGRLRFLGGVHLTSRDIRLGGLSALRWHDGVLLSVSDEGNAFAFRAIEQGDRLVGVADMRVRRLAGLHGEPLRRKALSDFEALEVAPDPACATPHCPPATMTVAREGDSAIWTYRMVDGLPVGRPIAMTAAAAWRAAQAHSNGGIEAMAGSHTLWLMASETLRLPDGRVSAMLLHNGGPSDSVPNREQPTGIEITDGFRPTDLVIVSESPATFLMLERWYEKGQPTATRLARFTLTPTADPATLAIGLVETLATLRAPLTTDNFEGLALRREGARIFLYTISDDNFSKTQRTLLMKWELLE